MAPDRILFVCVENSCRSQMAEGFARHWGDDRVRIYSAGSRPSGEVDPRAVRMMAEKGIDLAGQRSIGLDDLPDPKPLGDDEFRRVRDEIERRVRALLSAPVEAAD